MDSPELKKQLQDFKWTEKADKKLRVLCVNVVPGFRRKGLGTALVESLIQWAPDWDFKRLHVEANEKAWWIPCRPFWEKIGFEVVEIIEHDEPRPDGETRVFMMGRDL